MEEMIRLQESDGAHSDGEWQNRGGQRGRDLLCNQEQSKVETWCKSFKGFCLILGVNSWLSVSMGTSASQNPHHRLPVTHTVP